MLKIKDNVDLKELEKFGFEYNDYGYQPFIETPNYEKCIDEKSWFNPTIFVGCKSKKIQMFEIPDDDYRYADDTNWIKDLIKANLVEKASDENE